MVMPIEVNLNCTNFPVLILNKFRISYFEFPVVGSKPLGFLNPSPQDMQTKTPR